MPNDGNGNNNSSSGNDSSPRLLAAFRRTRQQAVGHGLFIGTVAGAMLFVTGVVIVAVRAAMSWRTWPCESWPYESLGLLGVLVLPAAIGGAAGAFTCVRTGIDADELGLHSVPALPRSSAPWLAITDIHAERRRAKTVVVIYLESGAVVRLRAPYDGKMLGRDPRFERKYFALLNLWETHRRWRSR